MLEVDSSWISFRTKVAMHRIVLILSGAMCSCLYLVYQYSFFALQKVHFGCADSI